MEYSHAAPRADHVLGLFQKMWRIRKFEEAASAARERGDAIGPVHMSIGQEAVPVGICASLNRADLITSTHRNHGHVLSKGADLSAMMCELFGRKPGICGGKGGSMHIDDFSAGVLGANGVVAAGITIAVGAAHASQIMKCDRIVVCFFGDGAINRGLFLEGLNWAKVYSLPILFVCEDNQFASITRTRKVTAGPGVVARAESLGVAGHAVDGNDVLAVEAIAATLIAEIRAGSGPQLLHCQTFRLLSHLVGDARVYRTDQELQERWAQEPLLVCAKVLREIGVSEAELTAVEQAAASEIDAAVVLASAAPWPDPEDAYTDIQDIGSPLWQH